MPGSAARLFPGLLALLLAAAVGGCAAGSPPPESSGGPTAVALTADRLRPSEPVLILGHRGAAGYRPEETLDSFETGVRQGADFIELDLVSTRDHVLVARHENELSGTTDVASHLEFAGRRTTKSVDGRSQTGWFTEDFTLAELRTLRARERIPAVRPGNVDYDGRDVVPTFDEVLALREALSAELGRPVGIAPETKHPSYFASIGLPIEPPMLESLRRSGLDTASSPVLIQSFELSNLIALRTQWGLHARTGFLIDAKGAPASTVPGAPSSYASFTTAAGLAFLRGKVDAIGPEKGLVIPRTWQDTLGRPTDLVAAAHAQGLAVMPFTFRAENQFLPADYWVGTSLTAPGRAQQEQEAFIAAGVDGLFTDQPDITVRARASADR